MHENFWKIVIKDLGFSEEEHDNILTYIDNHIYNEQSNVITTRKFNSMGSTLPLALQALKEIDLSKIDIIPNPIFRIDENTVETINEYKQPDFHFENGIFYQKELGELVVKETIKYMKEVLEKKEIYLYTLITDVLEKDNKYSVLHRYFEK